jgi:hypothetical protein
MPTKYKHCSSNKGTTDPHNAVRAASTLTKQNKTETYQAKGEKDFPN